MTTPSPYAPGPVPLSGPVLPPGQLALGDVLSGVLQLYRRGWKLFILLALLPALIIGLAVTVYVVAAIVLAGSAFWEQGSMDALGRVAGTLIVLTLLLFVVMFGAIALQYKYYGMIALGAVDLVNGRTPTFSDLSARTRGVALRALGVIIALGVAGIVGWAVVAALFMAPLMMAGESVSGSGAAQALIGILLVLVVMVAALVLSVRWLYFVPVLAVEGLGGFESLRRSWQLTRGEFWRTLGWYVVGSLLVGIPSAALSAISQPAFSRAGGNDPGAVAFPMLLVGLLSLAVGVVTAPFLELYRAVMYIDQLRRADGTVAAPPYGGWPQPGAAQYGSPQQYPNPQQYGAAPYSNPPRYGNPEQYNPQQYGNPQHYGTAPSGNPPQYGAPQSGAPQYGAPQSGAPQYGAPQYGSEPPAPPAGPDAPPPDPDGDGRRP